MTDTQETHDSGSPDSGSPDSGSPDSGSPHSGTYDFDAPPKGASRLTTPLVALAAFLLAALIFVDPFGWHGLDESLRGESAISATDDEHDHGELYTCPMHPEILQDEPGSCPICGMDLVLVEDGDGAGEAAGAMSSNMPADGHGDHDLLYTCPMHPEILQDEPGSCPICGMDLVPAEDDTGDTGDGQTMAGDEMGGEPVVSIDPQVVQKMNVRVEPVARRTIQRDLHAVGYLEVDPKRRVTVTTKTSGWVEKVHVHYVGEPVRKGQPLFEVYAPELVQTQQDLVSAQRYAESLDDAPEDTRRRARALVTATRTRLGYWDVPDAAVETLLATGEVVRTVTIRSPASGLVTRRLDGLEGMAVKPGLDIFEIADLSSLWLTVQLYENQVAWIDVGSTADIDLSYFPGESFTGMVRFIEPELRAETRTLGVRIEVRNPDRKLRAGMYAEVQLKPPAVEGALTVPSQAVLRTGERNLVVVALGDGRFQPRTVRLGHEGDGFVQVVEGLREGEMVTTSAQFLIDSESNLRAAIEQLRAARNGSAATEEAEAEPATTDPGHQH